MRSVVMRELCGPWVYDIAEPGTRLIFLMTKGEPHYYPSSLISGRTRFTCPWCGEFMNGNLIFSLKPKPPLPFLNPGGSSGRVSVFYSRFFLGGYGCGQSLGKPPCLTLQADWPGQGAAKVPGAVQPARASL